MKMTSDGLTDRYRSERSLLEALCQRVIAGRLTKAMFQRVFDVARRYLDRDSGKQTG